MVITSIEAFENDKLPEDNLTGILYSGCQAKEIEGAILSLAQECKDKSNINTPKKKIKL